jgi:predicted ArsR family transcriptional regulator
MTRVGSAEPDGRRRQPDDADRNERIQRQARALGDPTRHAIFRAIADASEPVDVATLTRHVGLNHNAVRQHLAKLCAAGLVLEESAAASGRGRPRLRYRPALGADLDWGIPSAYEQLAVMLLEVMNTGRSPREVGAEAGRRIAEGLAETPDPVDRLELNAARQGFEPRRVHLASSIDIVLGRCPFETAVGAAPDVVCQLHHGIADGISEASGGTVQVVDLIVAAEPSRGGCRLKLRPPLSPAPF